jgi:hypothetical protein
MSENTNPVEVAQPTRSLYFFKVINGNRVRWKLDVDRQMTIISEGPAENRPIPQQVAPEVGQIPPAAHLDNYKRMLDARGIKYTVNEQGQIAINDIPEKEKAIMQFFNLHDACPEGEGIAEIREQYKKEFEAIGGQGCSSCQLNGLQRKYREILKNKLP